MSGIRANHADDPDRDAADRLDALWDDLVQTGVADLSSAMDVDAARLSLISYAGHLVPLSDPAARGRVRQQIFADLSEGAMQTTSNVWTASAAANNDQIPVRRPWAARPNARRWWRRPNGMRGLAVTVALVIATISGIALLRPNDAPRSLPAAGSLDLGLGSPGVKNSDTASDDLLTIKLDGPPNTSYSILLARVTLQPGAAWDFPSDPVADISEPFDHLVESGTLLLGVNQSQHTSEPGNTYELDDSPSYVKNADRSPVTFLMAVAFTNDAMVLESPSGVTIQQLGNVPIPAIASDHEVVVHLTRSILQPDSGASLPADLKMSTAFVAVESGTLLARTNPEALVRSGAFGPDAVGSGEPAEFTGAPEDGIQIGAGETLTLDRTFVITDSAVVGDEPVELLALSYTVNSGLTAATCRLEPRHADDLRRLVQQPKTEPPDPGLRDQAALATPANQETAATISETVRDVLACSSIGSPLRAYSLFSDNALLAGPVANGLTLAEIDQMEMAEPAGSDSSSDSSTRAEPMTFVIDNIGVFPDGRAGAWINTNGEVAYVTFVLDPVTDRWLIDAWDDSVPRVDGISTPAA